MHRVTYNIRELSRTHRKMYTENCIGIFPFADKHRVPEDQCILKLSETANVVAKDSGTLPRVFANKHRVPKDQRIMKLSQIANVAAKDSGTLPRVKS